MSRRSRYSRTDNSYAVVPSPKIRTSLFRRHFGNKFTMDEGYLVPIHVDEIYAGDTLKATASGFIRMATPLTPIMDNIEFDLHAFFVPSRLLWDNYYKMLGQQDNPGDSTDYVIPKMSPSLPTQAGIFENGSLADYFGIPTGVTIPAPDLPITLPFRAYNFIWNEYYRDENLQRKVYFNTSDSGDKIIDFPILRRNKKHDYFTSCLPFAQKGEAVNLPLAGEIPVVSKNDSSGTPLAFGLTDGTNRRYFGGSAQAGNEVDWNYVPGDLTDNIGDNHDGGAPTSELKYYGVDVDSHLIAKLDSTTATTINDLRSAIAIQHILERNARSGTRDVELLRARYGVSPTDARMQRPEHIGSSRAVVGLTTIAQNSETTSNSPLGDLAAIGTIRAGINLNYSAVENGFIIVLASARCEINYQQGMRKMWSKDTALDILDPMLANIGEQPVLRKEICLVDNTEYNNEVFGYQPNYEDLRFGVNLITGKFRSNAVDSLDIWHLAEEFDINHPPVLSGEFIQQNSPLERCLAVENFPHFFGDFLIRCNHYRVLPVHSVPGLTRF